MLPKYLILLCLAVPAMASSSRRSSDAASRLVSPGSRTLSTRRGRTSRTPQSGDLPKRRNGGIDIPFTRKRVVNRKRGEKRDGVSGQIGLGDNSDLLYTLTLTLGQTPTTLHLDTGSSDLWVVSDRCTTGACDGANLQSVQTDAGGFDNTGASVSLYYGDSTTGTFARGPIVAGDVSIAGLSIPSQLFASIDATTNQIVRYGTSGIFGLGFPSGSVVQQARVWEEAKNPTSTSSSTKRELTRDEVAARAEAEIAARAESREVQATDGAETQATDGIEASIKSLASTSSTDLFVSSTWKYGPLISRLVQFLDSPMFAVRLQRGVVDAEDSTNGLLTLGILPPGIQDSDVTWVPVRLYSETDGGIPAPSWAQREIYPYRWEIDIDGVYLDGKRLANSNVEPFANISTYATSALIDTGNSLIRGPLDVVQTILAGVTGREQGDPDVSVPCSVPHTVAFEIGGKMFPVDPRDLITPGPDSAVSGPAISCLASTIVPTDAPNIGSLFRWSLGDPFLKGTTTLFYYGNLTHPSVDPPRIGFVSNVPSDAGSRLANIAAQGFTSKNSNAPLYVGDTVKLQPSAEFIASNPSMSNGAAAAPAATQTSTPAVQAPAAGETMPFKNGALSFRTGKNQGLLVVLIFVVLGLGMEM
ncbi:aspartic peptidase domain-containing protein [Mycena floridula]|nr:aspartic peptidase domain-containing protein [Mycena floridula]